MSLLHQGFNDYLYDEYYTIRQNQREGLGNQVSFREGGGFKHAFGVGQNIGMSNRFAASVNLVADVPFDDILKVFLMQECMEIQQENLRFCIPEE